MKNWLNRVFWLGCRWLLSFRYRVRILGGEQLSGLQGPTLVLPNHPAYIDPPIVSSHLRLHKPLRPMVFSGTYRMYFLRPLMKLVDAFEVPDLSAHSRDAQAKTLQMIDAVARQLQSGDCLLIYPSGRLQRGNCEVVGAARAVYEVVSRCENLNIVLVRTRGVWGSMFSCAETNGPPNLAERVKSALGWVLASGLFFLPRRSVTLQIEVVPRNQLPLNSREAFNGYLEAWYNADGEQPPKFVPYHHLFGPRDGDFGKSQLGAVHDISEIRPKTIHLVNELIQSHLGRQLNESELVPNSKLEALGLDSLDRMDLALKIEQQFGFRSNVVADTLSGLWALAEGQLPQVDVKPELAPVLWRQEILQPNRAELLADTVARGFVLQAIRNLSRVAVADNVSGVLTYRRMLVATELMRRRFEDFPEQHVGVMLPASVAADIVFFALHMDGKVPVMMNWTTGPANLAHAVQVTGVKTIITSRKMIDRLGIEVQGAEYLFLEDLKSGIGKIEALSALMRTYLLPRSYLARLPAQTPEQTAVFLFTSGSESFPKTVPLSHRNLLVNIQDGLEVLECDQRDSLLGFLPPFHSFGMTGNLLLSHLSGIRCVRYADPTDAAGLVRCIEAFRPTMLFTTPTFLSYILAACQGDELQSLRRIVTGAEKCPDRVFEQCKQKASQAIILEGYGITECSPVVAANRVSNSKPGTVGKPVSNVEVCIVDVDTQQPVELHQTGMLLVSGPSIFSGYHNYEGASPMVELGGKIWYKTGDLVSQDEDGFLYFRGRLKRFLKAGGEMISLPALEEPFLVKYPADENGPRVAVEGIETHDGRQIVLFTTEDISLREASQVLLEAGLRGVMRLDEVRRLEKIPILGTGKTDYKQLRSAIELQTSDL
ncbi:MAG: AMP-binding protein [Planctomycetales bacterium]|nr:AMP-binding protein [Planctomycetales bacterium]